MKIVAIIQARMGSSRLPQKVLKDLGGATVLDRVLNRVGRSRLIGELLVATTTEPADDAIVEHCERTGRKVLRGSEQDVLDRYYQAAKQTDADVVVRVTSDCPVIDPEVTDATIRAFLDQHADYASNVRVRTYPRGLDTEVMTVQALERAWRKSTKPYQREHVTPYIYENPGEFKLHGIENGADCSLHRWTLDTPEDLQLLQAIYARFGGRDDFGWREALEFVEGSPVAGRYQSPYRPESRAREMTDGGTLLVRCDTSVAIGTGHAMRCIALAQAWQDAGGCAIFAMAQATPALEDRLRRENMTVVRLKAEPGSAEDAQETVALAREKRAAWVVVDGYCFGADYQATLKYAGLKVLFVDDNGHAEHYSADLVLNQNAHAREAMYPSRDASTRLLLGPRFAMLRREFSEWRGWTRKIPAVGRKVLVTMGGSDPDNLTARAIEAIRQLSNLSLETVVLAGGNNPHLRSVEAAIQKESMRLITDATNMPELMAWADVAVACAGTTFCEMCFFGLPGILLVLAENQEAAAAAAGEMGTAWSQGKGTEASASAIASKLADLLNSSESRTTQCETGRKLVDSRGAERVVAFLSDLELRRVVESDCEVFWEWANDPETRAASFHSEPISWENHAQWFRARLADPKAILYTATTNEGLPVGEVRYQIEGKRAALSISLGARYRRCGWGQKILAIATERIFQDAKVDFIDAYVKPANDASLKLFVRGGFLRLPSELVEGQEGIHFVLERNALA